MPIGVTVRVRFSEPVDPDTLDGAITLTAAGSPVDVQLTPEAGDTAVRVTADLAGDAAWPISATPLRPRTARS